MNILMNCKPMMNRPPKAREQENNTNLSSREYIMNYEQIFVSISIYILHSTPTFIKGVKIFNFRNIYV